MTARYLEASSHSCQRRERPGDGWLRQLGIVRPPGPESKCMALYGTFWTQALSRRPGEDVPAAHRPRTPLSTPPDDLCGGPRVRAWPRVGPPVPVPPGATVPIASPPGSWRALALGRAYRRRPGQSDAWRRGGTDVLTEELTRPAARRPGPRPASSGAAPIRSSARPAPRSICPRLWLSRTNRGSGHDIHVVNRDGVVLRSARRIVDRHAERSGRVADRSRPYCLRCRVDRDAAIEVGCSG